MSSVKLYKILSDFHFNHDKAAEWRGFNDLHEMNEALVDTWNDHITNADTVINLGDFIFGEVENVGKILECLNFKKMILVAGNHDTPAKIREYAKRDNIAIHSSFALKDNIFTHIPIANNAYRDEFHYNYHGHHHSKRLFDGDIGIYKNVNYDVLGFDKIIDISI